MDSTFSQWRLSSRIRIVLAVLGLFLVVLLFYHFDIVNRGVKSTSGNSALSVPPRNTYSFAIVADKDKSSREGSLWKSIIKTGTLHISDAGSYSVSWQDETVLEGELNEALRGMELSELVTFGDKLLTCDDRTGIIYEVAEFKHVYARYILSNGDGNRAKGFKCEWMTVKDGVLFVGSTGKEWTTPQGVVLNHDPLWIKVCVLRFFLF